MMKIAKTILLSSGIFLSGCTGETKSLVTKSVTVGENKCIVQQMPEEFQEKKGERPVRLFQGNH